MAEEIVVKGISRKEKYENLIPQISSLFQGEEDYIANAANLSAALKTTFGFFWVGFYFVRNNQLVLGPYQGDIACTRINLGKGVCGSSWQQEKTIVVPDVDKFPGHIACSSKSKSEIVVPIFKQNKIIGVLDIDSDQLNDFNDTDQLYLEKIVEIWSTHSKLV